MQKKKRNLPAGVFSGIAQKRPRCLILPDGKEVWKGSDGLT
jgi:hypothetical protein